MFRANCLFLGQIVTFRANCLRPPSKMPSRTLMGKVIFHSLIVGTFQVDFARSWQKKLTWYIQNLCRFWECCCSKDHIKKSATRRLTLKRLFIVCLHHASCPFALYGQNEQGQEKPYDWHKKLGGYSKNWRALLRNADLLYLRACIESHDFECLTTITYYLILE